MDEIRELLLKKYAEAGQLTRQHEQLTRTSVSVFMPTIVALAGFIVESQVSNTTKVVLAVAGLALALIVANIVRRHQLYYCVYVARIRKIEESIKVQDAPVMQLYSLGKDATKCSATISNKTAFSIFFVLAAVFFGGSAVIYAWRLACPQPEPHLLRSPVNSTCWAADEIGGTVAHK